MSVKVPLLTVKLDVLKPSSWKLKGGAATTARGRSAPLLHHVSSRIVPRSRQVLTPPQMCGSWAKDTLPLPHHTSCILTRSDESRCCAATPAIEAESHSGFVPLGLPIPTTNPTDPTWGCLRDRYAVSPFAFVESDLSYLMLAWCPVSHVYGKH